MYSELPRDRLVEFLSPCSVGAFHVVGRCWYAFTAGEVWEGYMHSPY